MIAFIRALAAQLGHQVRRPPRARAFSLEKYPAAARDLGNLSDLGQRGCHPSLPTAKSEYLTIGVFLFLSLFDQTVKPFYNAKSRRSFFFGQFIFV